MVAIFSSEPDFEIVGTGVSADDAQHLADTAAPDVLITDMSMPGDVFAAIADVTRRTPPVRSSSFPPTPMSTPPCRRSNAGAQGFVLKGRPTTELVTAIRTVRSARSTCPRTSRPS